MFGAAQQASPFVAPSAGGLFGAASSGGMFGSSTAAPAGGILFGASAPASGSLFGAAPSPSPAGTLFGAPSSGTSLFGAQQSSTPSLFGASQPAPSPGGLFGTTQATSGGLFGAQSSAGASGGLFGAPAAGATGTSLLGASTGASLFGGAQSGGMFGATAQSGGMFGATASPSFLSPSSAVSLLGAQPAPSLFGGGQMAPAPQQQVGVEMAKNGRPITHETNFTDLPDSWQNAFKAVHGQISEVRRDWRALQSSVQVQASSQPELEYADLTNTAKQLSTDLEAARKQLELDCAAAERFHADMRVQADATQQVHTQLRANIVRREIETCRDEAQKQQKILQNAQLFKSMPSLPAPYLAQAVEGFGKELARLEALHQGLATLCTGEGRVSHHGTISLAALPDVLRSLHELFLHAAARLSQILAAAERIREAHLQAQAARGVLFDPFAEADAQAEAEKAERNQLPVIEPVKPSPATAGMAMPAAPAPVGQIGGFASTPQLGLPAPASSATSIFGGTSTFGNAGARASVKAKRR